MMEMNTKMPYSQQWAYGLQQVVPGKIILEANYTGNHVVHATANGYDLNAINPQNLSYGLALTNRVKNPLYGIIPATSSIGGSTISLQQSLAAFPAYTNVNVLNPDYGDSIYHGLTARAEKRMSHGLSLLASYTFGKTIGDIGMNIINFSTTGGAPQGSEACGQAATYDRRSCRSVEQDIAHRFTGSFVYELPFGPGHAWLKKRSIGSMALGGWQVERHRYATQRNPAGHPRCK